MTFVQVGQQRPRHAGIDFEGDEPKWFNAPARFYDGALAGIGAFLPKFERRAFALTSLVMNGPG